MRKQEWVVQTADALLDKWRQPNVCAIDAIRWGIEQALNHPEFEPDKPIYTYDILELSDNYACKYRIDRDGNFFDMSDAEYTSHSRCEEVARAIIEVLNRD